MDSAAMEAQERLPGIRGRLDIPAQLRLADDQHPVEALAAGTGNHGPLQPRRDCAGRAVLSPVGDGS